MRLIKHSIAWSTLIVLPMMCSTPGKNSATTVRLSCRPLVVPVARRNDEGPTQRGLPAMKQGEILWLRQQSRTLDPFRDEEESQTN